MRVVQLVMSRQYRGAEMFAAQLTRELNKLGVETSMIFLFKQTVKDRFSPTGVAYHEIDGHRSFINIKVLRHLAAYLKIQKPDVVQANAGDTLKYAVLVKMLFRMKFKIVFRNASTVSSYIRSPVQKWFNSILYSKVGSIVSVSHSSASDFLRTFPLCEHKIVVVPNGIEFLPVASGIFGDEVINLIHIGGFTFEKNHIGLLRIFEELNRKIPKSKLWLVGDGPLRGQVTNEVVRMGLSHCVEFVGTKRNVLDYISAADLLLLPSIIEGLPAVILEAFYCRTPVIAYDVGGISEVIQNGKTGWLVNSGDEAGFVNSIEDAIRSSSTPAITENAYNVVLNKYESKKIAKSFFQVYQDVLK